MAPRSKPPSKRRDHLKLVRPQYTLIYGMRVDRGVSADRGHARVTLQLPNGSQGQMALHIIAGTKDEIKAQLRHSIEAFFELSLDQIDQEPSDDAR